MDHFNRPPRGEKVSGNEVVGCWLSIVGAVILAKLNPEGTGTSGP